MTYTNQMLVEELLSSLEIKLFGVRQGYWGPTLYDFRAWNRSSYRGFFYQISSNRVQHIDHANR